MRKPFISLLLVLPLAAADLEFKEAFADPATRQASLGKLVPQTRDWFFYWALHQQLSGQTEAYEKTMEAWRLAFEWKNPVSGEGYQELRNRQLLLRFQEDPKQALDEFTKQLGLTFDDTKPDARAEEKLPDRLDPAFLTAEAFENVAEARSKGTAYRSYSPARLFAELDRVETFDPIKLRYFRENLTRADHPKTVALIARFLNLPNQAEAAFGSVTVEQRLVKSQLDELLAAVPRLIGDRDFAVRYLVSLQPGAETSFDLDPAAHAAHLAACRDFAIKLPEAQSSLKAHVLFHHLRLQRNAGNYPQEDFLSYLRLPRRLHPILQVPEIGIAENSIDPEKDYREATGCPPIHKDVELIQDYLQHFLRNAETPDLFKGLIEEKSLARLHSRARLLAGADPTKWSAALNPADVLELQKQTRISIAPGQPDFLSADTGVKLVLDLKNTPELAVRIYELDLPGVIEREQKEPDVDIDLDGLVPHIEKQLRFTQPPLMVHRETLDLPELSGPGAWIVECVSQGVASRALLRKGRLIPYMEKQARGQSVRVFNDKGELLRDASVTLGSETFATDEDGSILIPDKEGSTRNDAVVRHGKLAVPLDLASRRDEIALDARFHIDREQLLADQGAKLRLRLRLNSHGYEIPLEWIDKPSLTFEAMLLNGAKTEHVISSDLKLASSLTLPFQVPANATAIRVTFHGSVTPRDGADPVPISAQEMFRINGILSSSRIASGIFTRDDQGYRFEARGRNGEPLVSRGFTFRFHHRDYKENIPLQLRTDAKGQIPLGKLAGMSLVEVKGTDITEVQLRPEDENGWLELPRNFHLAAGEELRLPLTRSMAAPERKLVSLMETKDGIVLRDHFDKLAIEGKHLVVRDLPAGDFILVVEDTRIPIRVSGGTKHGDLLVSAARLLPHHQPATPMVSATAVEGESLVAKVEGASPGTVVTMIGRRFLHDWNRNHALQPFADPQSHLMIPSFTGNAYLEARRLSDEMRYIQDRRAAKIFPGSLLPRPGLLVNRWSENDLVQGTQEGNGGFRGHGGLSSRMGGITPAPAPSTSDGSGSMAESTAIDYLATPSVVRYDLKVTENGTVQVPAAEFVDSQYIEVIAGDAEARHHLLLPLSPSEPALRDRRLMRPLDATKYHVGTRRAAVLAKDAEANIESVLDAEWRGFTTLAEAHEYLSGATGDPNLEKFRPLMEWPSLDETTKLAFLSEHACNELHLFLARKDRPFFDKHVKPMLAEKREPKVIDDILLERDLSRYLRPFAWAKLNAVEKALLSQAMPEAHQRIAGELKQRWDLEAPTPEQETMLFAKTLGGSELAMVDSLGLDADLAGANILPPPGNGGTTGTAYIIDRLKSIVIPSIDFEDISVEEAVDFLRIRSKELDTQELDPARRGINFVIRRPRSGGADAGLDAEAAGGLGAAADPGQLRIKELRLRNVPLVEVLKYMCDSTKLRYKIDDFAVTLVPATETDEDLFTRSFRVPKDFLGILDGGGGPPEKDPFAEPDPFSSDAPSKPALRKSVMELLTENGVKFPEGANAQFFVKSGTLLVRNTPTNIDLIEQIVDQVAAGVSGALEADPFAASDGPRALAPRKSEAEPPLDQLAGYTSRPSWSSERDQTRLWRESNYYRFHGSTDETFIRLNRFWLDLAAWDGKGGFLSPHFNACTGSMNEALSCLAMLDLPFKAERPETKVDGSTLRVKAKEPMILFYKDTRETQKIAPDAPVLVRQTFHGLDDQFRTEDGRKIENSITGEFMTGVAYGASLVITNPSGAERRIDLLTQIPAGAIPLDSINATESTTRMLEPYGVLNLKLAFYFPAAGEFPIYPMQVSEGDLVLARSEGRTLKASAEAPALDANSWPAMARDASGEQILAHLRTANLRTLDLGLIRWRLRDPAFFRQVSTLLKERLYPSKDINAYAFFHGDTEVMKDVLENSGIITRLGKWFDSPLATVRPMEHFDWETFEYDPLVNPRAHRFAEKPRLTHEAASSHYEGLLDIFGWKPALNADDQLVLTASLLLQDRIGEALSRFDSIDPAALSGRLAYDYLHAVVLFHRSQPIEARAIAQQRENLPPGLWKDRFRKVIEQANEIVALQVPRKPDEEQRKEEAPSLDLALDADGKLLLKRHKLEKTLLQLFSVDLEVLFSKDPFLAGDGASLPGILANDSREIVLQGEETSVDLPENFRKGNVLVAAKSGTTRMLKVLDSRALEMIRQPAERTLQVYDTATRLPLAQAYVKVYVEGGDGQANFHKDGYTDLRGKFDYLSHTGSDLGEIRRISVLISHADKGARIEIFDL